MKAVEVILPSKHRWETMQNQSFWYTLVWTDRGNLKQLHLRSGEKAATVWVRRAETVVFCAYPLGHFAPVGSAVLPNGGDTVVLTEQEGPLCHLLLESSKLNSGALARVVYPHLLQEMRSKTDDFTLIDANRLQKDLVNGELGSSSIQILTPLTVMIANIPQGYWVGERAQDLSFWSYWDQQGPALVLGEGLHCFWNREDSLLLRVFVDLTEQVSFISVQKGPLW